MNNKKLILAASLLAFGFSKGAVAKENFDNRWYIAPSVSYVWTDSDRQTARDAFGLSLGVGKAISEDFNLELKGFYNDLDGKKSRFNRQNEVDIFGGTLDLQYYFNRNTLAPYAVIGFGASDSRSNGRNIAGFIGEAGVGVAYKINDSISLRSDVRYRYNDNFNKSFVNNTNQYNDMIVNFGVVIPFGSSPAKAAEVKAAPTAKPVAVAPKDSDNDGVVDSLDKCPDTKAGVKVNQVGCDLGITLKGVNFKSNSPILTAEAKVTLDKLASEINGYANKKDIEIQGHASSDGNKAVNLTLSQKRADAVAAYLKEKGVTNQLTSKGYGSEMPVADNATKEGRLQNRRVDLVWK